MQMSMKPLDGFHHSL